MAVRPLDLLRLAASAFALGPELSALLAMQAFRIGLIGAGLRDRLLVRGARCRRGWRRKLRQRASAGGDGERQDRCANCHGPHHRHCSLESHLCDCDVTSCRPHWHATRSRRVRAIQPRDISTVRRAIPRPRPSPRVSGSLATPIFCPPGPLHAATCRKADSIRLRTIPAMTSEWTR